MSAICKVVEIESCRCLRSVSSTSLLECKQASDCDTGWPRCAQRTAQDLRAAQVERHPLGAARQIAKMLSPSEWKKALHEVIGVIHTKGRLIYEILYGFFGSTTPFCEIIVNC